MPVGVLRVLVSGIDTLRREETLLALQVQHTGKPGELARSLQDEIAISRRWWEDDPASVSELEQWKKEVQNV
jgi:hypothetical protein